MSGGRRTGGEEERNRQKERKVDQRKKVPKFTEEERVQAGVQMKKEVENERRWSSTLLEQAMPRCHGSTVSPVSVGTAESCCSSTLPLGERERERERMRGGGEKGRRKTVTERRV